MKQDVSAYYDQTQNHYKRWWNLDKGMSLHYGLWHSNTKNFLEALQNTNEYMAKAASITGDSRILDAGCGVGGAAIFLASNFSANVTGVSLSSLQIETARANIKKHGLTDLVTFEQRDYTKTDFEDESFDVIWACESSSSAPDKDKMLKEWHRLLKPGGKLIILDFFRVSDAEQKEEPLLNKWCQLWAMSPLVTIDKLDSISVENGFDVISIEDLTKDIIPTIKWMYRSYLLGSLPAKLYNLFFGARKYSRNHYKSGLYQYKSHKLGLWKYYSFLAQKCD